MSMYKDMQEKILESGKNEFLAKGFQNASLEKIIDDSGADRDAFYGLYPDKETLFGALVNDAADGLVEMFRASQDAHFDLIPSNRTEESRNLSNKSMNQFVDYIYDHFDAFKLIISGADGTKYEHYIQDLVTMDVTRTDEYFAELRRTGRSEAGLSFRLHHMISTAYFTAVFETVLCDMAKEEALHYITEISAFFSCGWEGIKKH